MLFPTPMTKVVIVGPKSLERAVIDLLYGKRVVHIQDFVVPEAETLFRIGTPLEGADRASGQLIKLRAFKAALALENAPRPEDPPRSADVAPRIEASVTALEMSVTSVADEKSKLEAQVNELKARIEELRPFEKLPVPLALLGGYQTLTAFAGTVREGFETALEGAVRHLEVFQGEDPAAVKAILVDTQSREAAVKVLLDYGFSEARVPKGELPAFEEMQAAEQLLNDPESGLLVKLKRKESELDELKAKHSGFILAAAELLEMEVERCETPLRSASTPNTFMIEGFVPSDEAQGLGRALDKATKGKIYFDAQPVPQVEPPGVHGGGPDGGDARGHSAAAEAPVALKNPRAASAFEYLVKLMSLPKYNEVDPTLLMLFIFPVFFGMMLGDIGYGLAVLFLGWLGSRTRSVDLAAVGRLLMFGGAFSVGFGFLFGEFFGLEVLGSEPGPLKIWPHDLYAPALVGLVGGFDGYFPISRLNSVPTMLSVTIWIGVIHIFFGMALGFRNQLRAHGLAHAIYAKGSWIIVLVSGVIWMQALTGNMFAGAALGTSFYIGIGLFLVGFVLLLKGEGAVGAIELPTLLGNVLSYARLLAVGLSGVAIALTANLPLEWAVTDGGVVAILVGGTLGILGHLLGVFLGILGPGLHAVRLHYVEFFTKFYQGGGRPFAPLGKQAKYVAE